MKKVIGTLGAVALGAAAMYVMDPNNGRRRRAQIKDKAVSFAHKEGEMFARAGRDLRNRVKGVAPRLSAAMGRANGDSRQLAERVCSKIGRVVANPGALEVTAKEGRVTLQGDVLSNEVANLLSSVEACNGVTKIDNQLTVHDSAEGVPALQRGGMNGDKKPWAPGVALAAGAVGAAAAAYGLRNRGATGAALGAAGLGLVAKCVTDLRTPRGR